MGLFGKNDSGVKRTPLPAADTTGTTVIAEGTHIVGELNVEGKLHVDGNIEGTILVQGHVSIGRSGRCTGKIHADKVMVSGTFDGEITCNTIDILQNGRVTGEICSNELIIEPKGQFIGNSTLNETMKQPELPSPVKSVSYKENKDAKKEDDGSKS